MPRIAIVPLALLTLSASQFASVADSAGTGAYFGFVTHLSKNGAVTIIRNDVSFRPTVFEFLYDGDKVVVTGDASVTLQPDDGSAKIVLSRSKSRLVVHANAHTEPTPRAACEKSEGVTGRRVLSCIYSFAVSLGRSITRERDLDTIPGGSRGPEDPLRIDLPGLTDGKARIVSGARYPGFEFRGGSAPFHVKIDGPQGNLLDAKATNAHRIIFINQRYIEIGEYRIEVADSSGAHTTGKFTAIPGSSLLPEELNLLPTSSPAETRTLVAAAWRAKQDRERWSLEAYFEVVPLRNAGDDNADTLMTMLGDGGLPLHN